MLNKKLKDYTKEDIEKMSYEKLISIRPDIPMPMPKVEDPIFKKWYKERSLWLDIKLEWESIRDCKGIDLNKINENKRPRVK
jgi:hypothetical protein